MELEIALELASIDQYPLFLSFLDLRKPYNTLDHIRLISTLEVYGAGPQMWDLLLTLWAHREVVTRQKQVPRPEFKATQRKMQGGLISPTLINLLVDTVVHTWL